ncbi:LysE family translocator [Acuticoccus sp. MNP-M23]|uniref:LysE family translocator n=1 Tax=Acuticoccus sp. MNP-M23 TaxID=3072793 RepID=UPI002814B65A|nr:LysE family translocator [Acuticoccus sp. MNP-M23]WMS42590.1 LysE family translocator [Acuticoccus sp. MNP-M23]
MTVTAAVLAVFIPAAMLVAATPGANNLLSLMHGLKAGCRRTMLSLFGRMAAFALLLIAVATGLGALLAASEVAFRIVKWVGVAYLAYLGFRMWRAPAAEIAAEDLAPAKLLRKEFTVAITNPKAILLFTAFIPQFVDTSEAAAGQLYTLGAIYLVIEFAMASLYAFAGSQLRRADAVARRGRLFNRIGGGMMMGASALLATARKG